MNEIGDSGLLALTENIEYAFELRILNLCKLDLHLQFINLFILDWNNISSNGLQDLAQCLKYVPKLRVLNLGIKNLLLLK